LEDPRDKDEDMGRLYAQLATSRIFVLKEKYELGVDLEDKEGKRFIYACVCNDPASCESILQSSPNPGRLERNKSKRQLGTVLSVYGGLLEFQPLRVFLQSKEDFPGCCRAVYTLPYQYWTKG
jgi:hypothetical protein